jgi:hypothetical protein
MHPGLSVDEFQVTWDLHVSSSDWQTRMHDYYVDKATELRDATKRMQHTKNNQLMHQNQSLQRKIRTN